ncbi:MAG: hypothetical protein ABIJ59_10340 [Pseudomonadota bacterium]
MLFFGQPGEVGGRVDKEIGSLVASKIGLHVIGTASSFASGYSRAVSNNQSTFVYTVYQPGFSNGTGLKAILVDSQSGEIIWVNKGLWPVVEFGDEKIVKKLVADLLTTLPVK